MLSASILIDGGVTAIAEFVVSAAGVLINSTYGELALNFIANYLTDLELIVKMQHLNTLNI